MAETEMKNLVTLSVMEFLLFMEAEPCLHEIADPYRSMADLWDTLAYSPSHMMPFSDVITAFEPFMDKTIRSVACRIARTAPVAKGRVLWDLLDDIRSVEAVTAAESYCQGRLNGSELKRVWGNAQDAVPGKTRKSCAASVAASCSSDRWTAGGSANEAWMAATRAYEWANMVHCHGLLATIPNPFRLKNVVYAVTMP